MPVHEFRALLSSPAAVDDLAADGPRAVVLSGDWSGDALDIPPLLPLVVVADAPEGASAALDACDAVASGPALDALTDTVDRCPTASASLVSLLRRRSSGDVADGLLAESAVYGVLQAGPEFARWRAGTPTRERPPTDGSPVRIHRTGETLHVVLDRPSVRNALDAALRDALADALHVALGEPSLGVVLRGEGPSFCSGGDLDEFGSRSDPANAHIVRLSRSIGWMLHRLAPRTQSLVHGACRGSGVELPAFTATVVADPDATFGLPEVTMGLIPGAGGTVSIPARIGRQRTAWLALTGESIDAVTAHGWGLVDQLVPVADWPGLGGDPLRF
jgi:enoyl-CoA hydratase/carnithine racemase